jgi:purine-nucleoside phosphorylase
VSVGVILGSGLGWFADTLENRTETPYSQIPGWPASTAKGHAGKLVTGRLGDTDVVVAAGRAHLYEGYTVQQVAYSVRELSWRGVTSLIVTNASGGVNLNYKPGDLVLISDHLNLMGVNPLTGPEFIDMSDAYSQEYREIAKQAGSALGVNLAEGVYAALRGPSYETPAEIRYLRTIGADLVGMSTVPEVIAANHLGIKVLGISCVTNMAAGILPQKLTHQDVMDTGERVKNTLASLLRAVIPQLK